MRIIKVELNELKPDEGMCLTNGSVVKPPNESIYLAVNDSADNWDEITEEEYNEKQKEAEKRQAEMLPEEIGE